MIFCDFCALSPSQRKTLLTTFYRLLKPTGSGVLDVHLLNTFYKTEEVTTYERNQLDGFWSPDEYYGFLNTFKYHREKVTLDKYPIIEKARIRVIYNWRQYFSPDLLSREFGCGMYKTRTGADMKHCIDNGLDYTIYKLGRNRIKKMIQRRPGIELSIDGKNLK